MRTVTLAEASSLLTDGTHYTPPDIGVGVPFLTVTNMKANGLDLVGASKISECEFRKAAAQNCAPIEGDILFSKDGTVGKVWVVRAVQPFAVLSSIAIIRPDTRRVFPEYLAHFLRTPQSLATAAQRKTGSALTRIILKDIRNLRVPLPSLDEQKRIAAILDQADEIRGLRQSAIDRLDVLGQAIFYEMFGDPVKNPKGWDDRRTLGDASDIVSGITKGRKLNGKPTREVPYLAVVNVQDRELRLDPLKMIEATEDEINRYSLQKDDLLLTEGGDPDKLGRGTLWNNEIPECIHQNHIFRVRLSTDDIEPLFLNWLVGSERGKRYFLGSAKQTTGIGCVQRACEAGRC
jgi:type I restriction enzyme S subunit